jgi:peptide deformylase
MNSQATGFGCGPRPEDDADGSPGLAQRLSLVLYPDTILRTVCEPVENFDSTLCDLAEEMLALMRLHGGIGLAAPQVGLRQRLLVGSLDEWPLALANVEVREASDPRDLVEGCLSLPGMQINVRRPERIRVTGYDVHGQRRSFGATGLWARVIQHELDHLNGVLICDYDHPELDQCGHCPLQLPAELVEERKHFSRPDRGWRTQGTLTEASGKHSEPPSKRPP